MNNKNIKLKIAALSAMIAAAPTAGNAQTTQTQNNEGAKKSVVVDAHRANAQELFKTMDAFINNAPGIPQSNGDVYYPSEYDHTNNGVFRCHGAETNNGDKLTVIQYQDPALWAFTGEDSNKPKTQQSLDEMGVVVPMGGDIAITIEHKDGSLEKYEVTKTQINKYDLSADGHLIYDDSFASFKKHKVSEAEYKQLAGTLSGVFSNCEKESKAPEVASFCKKHPTTFNAFDLLKAGKTR